MEETKFIRNITQRYNEYQSKSLPLCAAENILSSFVRAPLASSLQEKYIMGLSEYSEENNFVGSHHLKEYYDELSKLCKRIFNAEYADARTLSGMNCVTTLLMSITKNGDTILLLSDQSGGHASMRHVSERLGLNIIDIEYDYTNYDIDYCKLNNQIQSFNPKAILLAPSDIIKPISINKIIVDINCTILYDASQLLGYIATGLIENPLDFDNVVLFGGTHKTIPGPTSGLILTNSKNIANLIEHRINPMYMRNSQMNNIVSLILALIELEKYGKNYLEKVTTNANYLSKILEKEYNFSIGKQGTRFTETHQIFLLTSKTIQKNIYSNSIKHHISLNKKQKQLFRGTGIRLGLQEVTRYEWNEKEMHIIASILNETTKVPCNDNLICELKNSLPQKKISYTFPDEYTAQLENLFHSPTSK